MLEIQHLSKTYHANKANALSVLRDINFSVERGDEISIIGKSGSGKSTLLHIMALIDGFQDGEMIFEGESVNNMKNTQLAELRNTKIGLILQDFALIPEYTVMDNILLPTFFGKGNMRNKKKRAEELLEQTGLSNQKKQYAAHLSGGQKQRVAVCRALINSPDLILADEPTGALDSKTGQEIISLLKRIHDDKKALVVITHDMDIAQSFSKQYALSDGSLHQIV